MKKKPPPAGTKPGTQQSKFTKAVPSTGIEPQGWGFRWHAGHFRTALWLAIGAIGIVLTFGQANGALAQWFLQDGYVATRATIVKAPYWAEAVASKQDDNEAIAGWHIDLRVGEYPFTLAVALADFDPDKNSMEQRIPPDTSRFAVSSVHPVWFYADNRKKQPATVALLQSTPVLLFSRAAFSRFPSLQEAMESSIELLIAPILMLSFAAIYLILAFVGKRGGNRSGAGLATRLTFALMACLFAAGVYLVNNEHPLAVHDDQYVPAEIEITRGPLPVDALTFSNGYRVLWRTWQVQAKLVTPGAQVFTIDVDGIDPRRMSWASRHSPDFSALQAGSRLAVWQSNFHRSSLENLGSMNPVIDWATFLSRERWPEKYTARDFVRDSPIATALIAIALLLAVVWLLPLGGRSAQDRV